MRTKLDPGKAFERKVESVCAQYAGRSIMRIKKVEPPTRTLGFGAARRVIFLENPFLDFVGAWTLAGGKAILFEAKSTAEPRLPILQAGGLTETQVKQLHAWKMAGAVAFVLWEWRGAAGGPAVAYIQEEEIHEADLACAARTGPKHLKWDEARTLPAGTGFVTFDFHRRMRAIWGV